MTRRRYSKKESWNRWLSTLKGVLPNSDQPDTLPGEILSEDEALSDMVELWAGSLPGESLTFPNASYGAITSTSTITGEDLVINDNADIDNLTVSTGTLHVEAGHVAVGGMTTPGHFGGGGVILAIGVAGTVPTGSLTNLTGILYNQDGALYYLGGSGSASLLAGS